jgi:hypothetical protein
MRKREWATRPYDLLTTEELARITEIQDLLIDLYVRRSEALEDGDSAGAKQLDREISGLRREREKIEAWAIA